MSCKSSSLEVYMYCQTRADLDKARGTNIHRQASMRRVSQMHTLASEAANAHGYRHLWKDISAAN